MYDVHLRKTKEDHVLALILGPGADPNTVEQWSAGEKCESKKKIRTLSAALEHARERNPATWTIVDPNGIAPFGSIVFADVDRLINPA